MKYLTGSNKRPYMQIVIILFAVSIVVLLTPTTNNIAKQAGGIACFAFAIMLVMSVLKTLFFEIGGCSRYRYKITNIIKIFHKYLGLIIFVMIIYHAVYYINKFINTVDLFSTSCLITGTVAAFGMVAVVVSGLINGVISGSGERNYKLNYLKHIILSGISAVIIVSHINAS